MSGGGRVGLRETVTAAVGRTGVVWTLEGSQELNANLMRFSDRGGVGGRVNAEVDLLFSGASARGTLVVDGEEHDPEAGSFPGARRSTRDTSGGPLRAGRQA